MHISKEHYYLYLDSRPEYLYARVRNYDFNGSAGLDYLDDIVAECNERNYQRLMIEKDIPKTLTDAEMSDVMTRFAERGFNEHKIAFVDTGIENPNAHNDLVKPTGPNRDFHAASFDGQELAEAWLIRD